VRGRALRHLRPENNCQPARPQQRAEGKADMNQSKPNNDNGKKRGAKKGKGTAPGRERQWNARALRNRQRPERKTAQQNEWADKQ